MVTLAKLPVNLKHYLCHNLQISWLDVSSINQVYFTQVSMAETEYTYKKKKKTDNKKNRSQVYSHKTFHSSIT